MLYSATMSLDGFIDGPGGYMQWMTPYLGPNPTVTELIGNIGALLIGRRTFGGDDPHKGDEGEGKAFGGGWEGPQFVLTHRPPDEPVDGITFVTDLETAVTESRAAAGDGYVNVIGADVARQLIAVGELDEVLAIVAPVLLGDGTRLFDWPGGHDVRLERIHLSDVPHATNLWFRVLR
jgi:dihydrofolate reductase